MYSRDNIQVSRPFMPPQEEYQRIISTLWDTGKITNNGVYVKELEKKLADFLEVPEVIYCTNGTIALQLALEALNIYGEVITTPFSYIATVGSILWQKCTPIFVDINSDDLCINAELVEKKITENTKAIVATHIFGIPCNVDKLSEISKKYHIPLIYDAAHAFACKWEGLSLLSYGDISTCSFNATKIFHTIEGGCVVTKDSDLAKKIRALRYFGITENGIQYPGVNAKQSEFHAAMGLINFNYLDKILEQYSENYKMYKLGLRDANVSIPVVPEKLNYNYGYFPVLFPEEEKLLKTEELLNKNGIYGKRYFYPSLNTLGFVQNDKCPVSEELSRKILCLPMFYDLTKNDIEHICELIRSLN